MLNAKLYKSVHNLAESLLEAATKENTKRFESLYAELKAICVDNENTKKDHPVQWETLADFTEDLDEAVEYYAKALVKSVTIDAKEYMASIAFSMATLQIELGQTDAAIKNLQDAKNSASNIEDQELKDEIDELLASLK